MWITTCPSCQADNLYVVGFTASCRIPLFPDGFSTADTKFFNTEDEKVQCGSCNAVFNLAQLDEDRLLPDENQESEA